MAQGKLLYPPDALQLAGLLNWLRHHTESLQKFLPHVPANQHEYDSVRFTGLFSLNSIPDYGANAAQMRAGKIKNGRQASLFAYVSTS